MQVRPARGHVLEPDHGRPRIVITEHSTDRAGLALERSQGWIPTPLMVWERGTSRDILIPFTLDGRVVTWFADKIGALSYAYIQGMSVCLGRLDNQSGRLDRWRLYARVRASRVKAWATGSPLEQQLAMWWSAPRYLEGDLMVFDKDTALVRFPFT